MKVKTFREKIKESVQRTLSFCFIHENFLKSLGLHKLKNVSYSKLKWNTFIPLELFAELSQFLSAATKVSNKIRAVELTSMTNNLLGTAFLPGQVDHHWIILCLHAQRLSKSIKSWDYRLCWFVASMHNFKNFAPGHKSNPSLDLLLKIRTYLRKSLFCWLNLLL